MSILSCDCYPGCWGDHSKEWPTIDDPSEAVGVFLNMASNVRKYIQYGDYVRVDGKLRVPDEATKKKVEEFYKIAEKYILEANRGRLSGSLQGEAGEAPDPAKVQGAVALIDFVREGRIPMPDAAPLALAGQTLLAEVRRLLAAQWEGKA